MILEEHIKKLKSELQVDPVVLFEEDAVRYYKAHNKKAP